MVAARRIGSNVHVENPSANQNNVSDVSLPTAIEDADEWLQDVDEVNEIPLPDTLHWKEGAKPGTRKCHNGFGRSSTFARKAQMKKMQVGTL